MRQSANMRAYLPPSGAVRAQAPMAATRPVLRSPRPKHEHRADRHGGAAGQTRYGLGRREDAAQEEHDRNRQGDLVHPDPVEGEQDERCQRHAEHECDIERHGV